MSENGFIDAEVPMVRLADGRDAISDEMVKEYPWVSEFIDRFSNYWAYDAQLCAWVSPTIDAALSKAGKT